MITRLKVDGFRSLSRFDMEVKPGLNILVGPNGSGKTNIVSFLQFLSYITSYPLSDAVAKAGGAGAVFQKIGSRLYRKSIKASIEGTYEYEVDSYLHRPPSAARRQTPVIAKLRYVYSFELSASPDLDVLAYELQEISAWKHPLRQQTLLATTEPDLQICLSPSASGQPDLKVVKISAHEFDLGVRFGRDTMPEGDQLKEVVRRFLGQENDFFLQRLGSLVSDLRYLRSDFSGGEIFNIIPSQVRLPEDSAKAPSIQSDGSGFAATLFALQKNTVRLVRPSRFGPTLRQLPQQAFSQIIRYMQTVNESILKLSVTNDPFDNRLKVAVTITGEDGDIDLPFSSMSDGTVKWASLITAILTYETIFAIEEPENFLHPLMQREILNILRENLGRRGNRSFVIMTTHSETLLKRGRSYRGHCRIDFEWHHPR
jgi:predicted ATPase